MNTLARMPGFRRLLNGCAATLGAAVLAACGGSDGGPIPEEAGRDLLGQLDAVERAVSDGDCDAAESAADDFAQGINELPPEVEGELRVALDEASANLKQLTAEQCEPETGPTGETVPTTTTQPPTTTTEATTTTTTTEEPPEEGNGPPVTPPGGGNQDGGNAGGGNPGGGGNDSSGGIGSGGG